jgi:phosphatidylglycerol lysyltransferase
MYSRGMCLSGTMWIMKQSRRSLRYAYLIAGTILSYGISTVTGILLRQLQIHGRHDLDEVLLTFPGLIGLSYIYLGTLLLRLKRNAWLMTFILSIGTAVLNISFLLIHRASGRPTDALQQALHLFVPLVLVALLYKSRDVFRVRSDMVGFRQAVRASVLVLLVAFVYGTLGFCLMDSRDFHQEISLPTAMHQAVDQFGVTTPTVSAYTRRSQVFMDSLSLVSLGAAVYVVLAFFQPIRFHLRQQGSQRGHVRRLLEQYDHDIDDFFKLWPHDKQYFFTSGMEAGLAYHVARGVALVVADPFGDPKQFTALCQSFQDFCFVNDWRLAFVHVTNRHAALYEELCLRMQKIGEEAVLDLTDFAEHMNDKYFRQIRNRFTKLGYTVEILDAPYDPDTLDSLRAVSTDWMKRPGRTERGFMLGYYSGEYMRESEVAVVRDGGGRIRGFMNLIPTYINGVANYDLLRCDADTPGNCNDFLLLSTIALLQDRGYSALNLGLCPLRGFDAQQTEASMIDAALRLLYANGDRLYSFSGLERFKAKYHPHWEPRYVAYAGGMAGFARTMRALTRAMKVK